MGATRVDVERGGATAVIARLGAFEVQSLRFPAGHALDRFEFEHGYVAVVLDGALEKTFARASWSLARGSVGTLPVGAVHSTEFGPAPTHVVTIARRSVSDEHSPSVVRRLRHVRAPAATALGWRLATELAGSDPWWALAAEGLVLQLVALGGRADAAPPPRRRATWLRDVRDLLHERVPEPPSLSDLADAVGVHPVHLARSFRREYGVPLCEYARRLRLEWVEAQLAVSDAPIAELAAASGFADQSHLTRAFRRHVGVTPGRYRRLRRG